MKRSLVVADTVKRQHIAKKAVILRNRRVRMFCIVMLVVVCMALLYVWTRIYVVQQGYQVSTLQHDVSILVDNKRLLEAEVAKLKSPSCLEEKARRDLGMRPPRGDEIIFVEP